MDLSTRVTQNFHEHINTSQISLEVMTESLVNAAESLTQCLLAGGKILTCGDAGSGLIAEHMAALLLGRLQLPRPGLPAICLSTSQATLAGISHHDGHKQMFASQIAALGQHTDVLVMISGEGGDDVLLAAAQEAQDRDMRIVLLTAETGDELSASLSPMDIQVSIPAENSLRAYEIQVLAVHCICDLIDNQLLGQ